MSGNVQALFDEITRLSPADKLRLAAELLDMGRVDTGAEVVRIVHEELTLLKLKRAARGGRS